MLQASPLKNRVPHFVFGQVLMNASVIASSLSACGQRHVKRRERRKGAHLQQHELHPIEHRDPLLRKSTGHVLPVRFPSCRSVQLTKDSAQRISYLVTFPTADFPTFFLVQTGKQPFILILDVHGERTIPTTSNFVSHKLIED